MVSQPKKSHDFLFLMCFFRSCCVIFQDHSHLLQQHAALCGFNVCVSLQGCCVPQSLATCFLRHFSIGFLYAVELAALGSLSPPTKFVISVLPIGFSPALSSPLLRPPDFLQCLQASFVPHLVFSSVVKLPLSATWFSLVPSSFLHHPPSFLFFCCSSGSSRSFPASPAKSDIADQPYQHWFVGASNLYCFCLPYLFFCPARCSHVLICVINKNGRKNRYCSRRCYGNNSYEG